MSGLIPIADVEVGPRHRKDMGDIEALAASIGEQGLLQPIGITPANELVFGARRLEACRSLGWTEIDARVVNVTSMVEGEFAENEIRKAFRITERVAIARAVEQEIGNRQGQRTDRQPGEKIHQVAPGEKTFQAAAKKAGFGNDRTFRQAREVIEAAEQDDRFIPLVEEMDRRGKVGGVHRKLRQAIDEERVLSLVPREGRYRTLIVDPPWSYDAPFLDRAEPDYTTMSHEDIGRLPVPGWAEDSCHLYLWCTNAFIDQAIGIARQWGFEHKTVLTWVKNRFGLGAFFRNSTEHVVFAVRGGLRTRCDNIATHFQAPVGQHSVKPEAFYDIVRQASYPSYGEVFQRDTRDGIANLFEERKAG